MSEVNDIAKKRIVLDASGPVRVRRDIPFATAGEETLTMDLYEPAGSAPRGAVILVGGYPDNGFRSFIGCRFKEMGSTVSWAELLASSGLAAIAYTNVDPLDVRKLLQHIREDYSSLGIDPDRIALLASSGNGPVALSLLGRETAFCVRCAAICYAYTIDVEGSTAVADAAQQFRFANPGTTIEELRNDAPLLIVRAGADQTPNLNESLDSFVSEALRRDLPLTLVNVPRAPHAFDLVEDSDRSRSVIRRIATFLAENA